MRGTSKDEGLEIAFTTLFNRLNGPERLTEEQLYQFLVKQHTTLQQAFFRVINQIIYRYGDKEGLSVDARNEASVEFCKRLSESEARFVGLPVI